MSFAWPHLLWLLAVPVALLAWELSQRRRTDSNVHPKMLRAEADFNHLSLVPRHTARRLARLWFCAGLALSVIALARPQWGRTEEQVFDQSREILIAVDLSRSMLSQDVKPSRLDRAKLLIQSLLERLAGERIGLLVFSGTAFLQSPLSSDYEILREFLPALGPDYLPEGGTNYRALLDTAVQAFGSSSAADRFLIILSDGEATDEDWKPAIEDLKKKGIRVIGLGVGTASGAMIPDGGGGFVKDDRGAVVLSKLESGTLQQLAQATSGVYRDASTWLDLAGLIQETVDAGRKGEFVDKNQIRQIERFQWALAPALLCLALSFWREFPVRPKPRALNLAKKSDPGRPPPDPGMRTLDSSGLKSASNVPLTSALAFVLLASGLWLLSSARAAVAPVGPAPNQAAPEPDPASAPLAKVVGRLAPQAARSAADWAELARTTVSYGEHLHTAQQPVPESPVRDALAAVDAGIALDAKAADWLQLRKDLEALLEKPDQKQNPPPPDQQKKDQKDSDQQKQDQQKQDQDQKQKDQSDQKKQQSGNEQNKQDSQSKKPDNPEDQKSKDEKQKEDAQSAFGDMKQPPPTPPPPSSETQKVGGAPEKKGEPKELDPALALPLQKLDQLKNQDAPAKLFQLMEGERKPETPKKGKNW